MFVTCILKTYLIIYTTPRDVVDVYFATKLHGNIALTLFTAFFAIALAEMLLPVAKLMLTNRARDLKMHRTGQNLIVNLYVADSITG